MHLNLSCDLAIYRHARLPSWVLDRSFSFIWGTDTAREEVRGIKREGCWFRRAVHELELEYEHECVLLDQHECTVDWMMDGSSWVGPLARMVCSGVQRHHSSPMNDLV